jgi:formamidopyrimidine-DNA glycosylase
MPELPEVETIRTALKDQVLGKEIVRVKVNRPQIIGPPGVKPFIRSLTKDKFTDLVRRGKFLAFQLASDNILIVHLRMTGRLLLVNRPIRGKPDVAINFSNGSGLIYEDRRHLGRILILSNDSDCDLGTRLGLGLEPFSPDFTGRWLAERLQKSRRAVKLFLVDQKIIAGLGNIYACEALFKAGIHPLTPCCLISSTQASRLKQAILFVLKKAVSQRGTSFSDYVDASGRPGNYQHFLKVYGREGERCFRCRANVVRIKHQGRSSYLCPGCQSLPGQS